MKSLNLYRKKFEEFGASPKSLLWKTRGAAHQRFRVFWKYVDFNGKSVLDVGCGFGEFGKFLLKRYEGVKYAGVDINPNFIENAKKLVPGGRFEVRDYLKNKIEGKYDIVAASGILNSNTNDNLGYRKKAIKKLFGLTDNILIFNMLGGHPAPSNKKGSNIWYADSIEILEYCMSLTRRVVLISNYHPKDFTILMQKVKNF